jgi:hypothetical protein
LVVRIPHASRSRLGHIVGRYHHETRGRRRFRFAKSARPMPT